MKTEEAIEVFLEAKVGVRAPKTIKWYKGNLKLFLDFIGENKEIESVSIHDLRRWRAKLTRQKLTPWTIHGYLRAVKYFFNWLNNEKILNTNPTKRLELPRLPKIPRQGILDIDRDSMLEAARSFERPRDYAILIFAATTGCRENGLATLKVRNLDIENMQALVTEKGMKSRIVFFEEGTKNALIKWLEIRSTASNENVFITREGEPLTTSGIYQVFKRIALRAGVRKKWNPHQWRHAFARNFLKNGGDIGILSQLLGHSDIRVTLDHYGGLTNGELQTAHSKYAPRLNMTNT